MTVDFPVELVILLQLILLAPQHVSICDITLDPSWKPHSMPASVAATARARSLAHCSQTGS